MSGNSSFLGSFCKTHGEIVWALSRESVPKTCKHSHYCHAATFHGVIMSLKTYVVFLKAPFSGVISVIVSLDYLISAIVILILKHFTGFHMFEAVSHSILILQVKK